MIRLAILENSDARTALQRFYAAPEPMVFDKTNENLFSFDVPEASLDAWSVYEDKPNDDVMQVDEKEDFFEAPVPETPWTRAAMWGAPYCKDFCSPAQVAPVSLTQILLLGFKTFASVSETQTGTRVFLRQPDWLMLWDAKKKDGTEIVIGNNLLGPDLNDSRTFIPLNPYLYLQTLSDVQETAWIETFPFSGAPIVWDWSEAAESALKYLQERPRPYFKVAKEGKMEPAFNEMGTQNELWSYWARFPAFGVGLLAPRVHRNVALLFVLAERATSAAYKYNTETTRRGFSTLCANSKQGSFVWSAARDWIENLETANLRAWARSGSGLGMLSNVMSNTGALPSTWFYLPGNTSAELIKCSAGDIWPVAEAESIPENIQRVNLHFGSADVMCTIAPLISFDLATLVALQNPAAPVATLAHLYVDLLWPGALQMELGVGGAGWLQLMRWMAFVLFARLHLQDAAAVRRLDPFRGTLLAYKSAVKAWPAAGELSYYFRFGFEDDIGSFLLHRLMNDTEEFWEPQTLRLVAGRIEEVASMFAQYERMFANKRKKYKMTWEFLDAPRQVLGDVFDFLKVWYTYGQVQWDPSRRYSAIEDPGSKQLLQHLSSPEALQDLKLAEERVDTPWTRWADRILMHGLLLDDLQIRQLSLEGIENKDEATEEGDGRALVRAWFNVQTLRTFCQWKYMPFERLLTPQWIKEHGF